MLVERQRDATKASGAVIGVAQIGHNSHPTPLLDQINEPADLRRLDESQLRELADELRAEMIEASSP